MASLDCPYVGLAPFTEEQAEYFFGRERDQQFVVANLFATRLTVLYGPSAAGKSSLLRAGVVREIVTRMEAARRDLGRADLNYLYLAAWEGDAYARLCQAVVDAIDRITPGVAEGIAADASFLDLLAHAVHVSEGDFFVILDQFEEYFAYHPAGDEPARLERELADAITRRNFPVSVLIALRDDELWRLDRLKPLVPGLLSNPLALRRLTLDQARRAITAPLEAYNALPPEARTHPGTFTVEPTLVDAVLADVRPGRVPAAAGSVSHLAGADEVEAAYLQLVMTALWEREIADRSTSLHHDTLRALGGAAAIVRRHFDTVMQTLAADDREVCARLLHYLVTPSGQKIPHRLSDLASYADVSVSRLEPIVTRLMDRRILASGGLDTIDPAARTYAIRHDALGDAILVWRRDYLAQREQDATARRHLNEVMLMQAGAKSDRDLAEQRGRKARRLRYVSGALATLAAVAVGLTLYLADQSRQSDELRRRSAELELLLRKDLEATLIKSNQSRERLRAYQADLEQHLADSAALRQRILSLGDDPELKASVARIQQTELDLSRNRQALEAATTRAGQLEAEVVALTAARDRANDELRRSRRPIVILQVRPRRVTD